MNQLRQQTGHCFILKIRIFTSQQKLEFLFLHKFKKAEFVLVQIFQSHLVIGDGQGWNMNYEYMTYKCFFNLKKISHYFFFNILF